MIRATTPRHYFIFDTDPDIYKRILITYAQGDKIVLEKEKEDLFIEATDDGKWVLSYQLTQEETKKFTMSGGGSILVQVRVLTESGDALASDKQRIRLSDVLNDEVLV